MVAVPGVPVVPALVVLALVVPVVAGSPSAWEPGSLGAWEGHFLPSLGSLESLKEPGSQEGPNRGKGARNRLQSGTPGYSPNRPEQGKGARKLPIYIGVFRAFRSSSQKSKFRFGQHAI